PLLVAAGSALRDPHAGLGQTSAASGWQPSPPEFAVPVGGQRKSGGGATCLGTPGGRPIVRPGSQIAGIRRSDRRPLGAGAGAGVCAASSTGHVSEIASGSRPATGKGELAGATGNLAASGRSPRP